MIKIRSTSQIMDMEHLHKDILYEVKRTAGILDMYYNSRGNDGGYVVIAECEEDLERIKKECIDYTAEPIELITRHGFCLNILFLPATEYSISVILKDDIAPKWIKDMEADYE